MSHRTGSLEILLVLLFGGVIAGCFQSLSPGLQFPKGIELPGYGQLEPVMQNPGGEPRQYSTTLNLSASEASKVLQPPDSPKSVQSSQTWHLGILIGLLLVGTGYLLTLVRLGEFRRFAQYGLFVIACSSIMTFIQNFGNFGILSGNSNIHIWNLRIYSAIACLGTISIAQFEGRKIFILDKQAKTLKIAGWSITFFALLPLSSTSDWSPLLAGIIALLSLSYILAISREISKAIRFTVFMLVLVSCSFSDWLSINASLGLKISMVHGFMAVLAWQIFQTFLQILNGFHGRLLKQRVQTSYLSHLLDHLRRDTSKLLLISSQDTLEQSKRKMIELTQEVKQSLNKLALNIERAQSALGQDPFRPHCNWQRVSASDVLTSLRRSLEVLIQDKTYLELKLSNEWPAEAEYIYTDLNLLSYLIHDLLAGFIGSLKPNIHFTINLKYQNEVEDQLIFITLVASSNEQMSRHPSQSNNWEAEAYLIQSLEFTNRMLQGLKGQVSLKRNPNLSRSLELQLDLSSSFEKTESSSNQLKLALVTPDFEPKPLVKNRIQTGLSEESSCKHAILLSERSDFNAILQSILLGAEVNLETSASLREVHEQIAQHKIELIAIYYETDARTAATMLRQLRFNERFQTIPIIVFTLDRNQNNHLLVLAQQPDDLILLPASVQELLGKVKRQLSRYSKMQQDFDKHEQRLLTQDFQVVFPPHTEKLPGISLECQYQPATMTSGDWYQTFYDARHHRLYTVVGDVAGSGRKSALIASIAIGAFRAITLAMTRRAQTTPIDRCLWELIEGINQAIYDAASQSERTMAASFIVLDMTTGDMLYSSAGHGPVFLVNETQVDSVVIGGRPFGITREIKLNYRRLQLDSDSAVFLSTDGLLNNKGSDGKKLNHRQLVEILQAEGSNKSKQIADTVINRARKLWGLESTQDDVIILVIYWSHASNPMFLEEGA